MTDMQHAIEIFRQTYPEYARADGARDQCKVASARFRDILIAQGMPIGRAYVDEVAFVDDVLHYATVVETDDGLVIYDFTARQFLDDAPWPVIVGFGVGEKWDVVPQSRTALTYG